MEKTRFLTPSGFGMTSHYINHCGAACENLLICNNRQAALGCSL